MLNKESLNWSKNNFVIQSYFYFILFLFPTIVTSPVVGIERELSNVWGINFGDTQEKVIDYYSHEYSISPNRIIQYNNFQILEYRDWNHKIGKFDKLRIFVHHKRGVFSIEEEYYLRWNLQIHNEENIKIHQKKFDIILTQIRKQFGKETFLEKPTINKSLNQNDFVSASWDFKNNRWIHLIYEPQEWNIFPELMKVIIVYRDSNRDPRGKD